MDGYTQFHDRRIQEIIPESQSELLGRILPVAIAVKEGRDVEAGDLTEFSYLVKIWRDREVLWAQYPAGLLACKTIGDLVDYLYKRHQQVLEQERNGICRVRSNRSTVRALPSIMALRPPRLSAVPSGNSLQ